MQPDKDITIYIGVTNNCNTAVIDEISKCCALLTSKNTDGGKLLLVTESHVNYPLADYLINMEESDVLLTRKDHTFNVKLDYKNSLCEVLYALTASWFLANLVGHDYADYIACFSIGKNSQLDIIEVGNTDDLRSLLVASNEDKLPTAMTCYIEAAEKNMTYAWFEEFGNVLQQFVNKETLCVVTMSSKPRQQSKSKIYLTWFYQ